MKACLYTLLVILATSYEALPQAWVARNFLPDVFEDTTLADRRFLNNMAFSVEAHRGYGSAQGEQAWNVKYFGLLELYRFGPNLSLSGILGHEFMANPFNEINFHMRGSIWNETVMLLYQRGDWVYELGITHHCKHEIDNSIPFNEEDDDDGYVPSRRLLVLTTPYLALKYERAIGDRAHIHLYGRSNYYYYRVDGRRGPDRNRDQDLENLRASMFAAYRLSYDIGRGANVYSRTWFNPVYFIHEEDAYQWNGRTELGLGIEGDKAVLELFGAYEKYFDDYSRPFPQPSTVFYIGVRGRSRLLF